MMEGYCDIYLLSWSEYMLSCIVLSNESKSLKHGRLVDICILTTIELTECLSLRFRILF